MENVNNKIQTKKQLKNEQELKDYLIEIIQLNSIQENSIVYVGENVLIMPYGALKIEKA